MSSMASLAAATRFRRIRWRWPWATLGTVAVLLCGLTISCGNGDYLDESFGVLDLSDAEEGKDSEEKADKVARQKDPTIGFVNNGERAEFYEFGRVPMATDVRARKPLGARVAPMYFFYDSRGYPIFSRPARETRDFSDWMKGGKNVLDPNPKDFCAGQEPNPTCEGQNEKERQKRYPGRIRDRWLDPLRGIADYQRPVVDVTPFDRSVGRPHHTGFWEVVEVTVPNGYQPDNIKHAGTLERGIDDGEFKIRRTGKVIDCPIVDERTVTTPGVTDRSIFRPRVELWYRRRLTFCYLVHGWESLGDDKGMPYLAGPGQDAQRVQTFDVAKVSLGEGSALTYELIVPVGKAYEPVILTDPLDSTGVRASTATVVADNLLTRGKPRRKPSDPPGYTPLRWMHRFEVDGSQFSTTSFDERGKPKGPPIFNVYQAGGIDAVDKLDPSQTFSVSDNRGPVVLNTPIRGAQIPCSLPKVERKKEMNSMGLREFVYQCGREVDGESQLDASNDPACNQAGLECNRDTCFCDLPAVGYGKLCGPTTARCSETPEPFAPTGYECFPPWGGACHVRCSGRFNQAAESNLGKEPKDQLDSRCKERPGFLCFSGIWCLKTCNPELKEDQLISDGNEMVLQCHLKAEYPVSGGMSMVKDINAGQTCLDLGSQGLCTWPEGSTPPF